jgi:small-conductance mechanosensitive channel
MEENRRCSVSTVFIEETPRVKTDTLASLAFGFSLVILGGFLIRWHMRMWRGQRDDKTLEEREISHFRGQLRRRIQVSILLIVLGVLIPLWDVLTIAGWLSKAAALLWIIIMLLVALWIMVLALLDWISSRVHRHAMLGSLASLARKRRELEEELARLRLQQRNGRG